LATITLVDESQAGVHQHLLGEFEPLGESVPLVGRPAELELARYVAPDTARLEILARRSGVECVQQSFVIPLDGLLHRRHRRLAFLTGRSGVGVVVQFDASAIGQESQRVHEVEVLDLAHERDLVTRGATAKAVVAALFGVHRERRGLLPVKRAQSGPATTGLLQGDGLTDQGHNVGRRRTCAISLSDMAIARRYRFSLASTSDV
jgi:hypothetical protein